jgi:hypothetical protein
MQQQETVVSSPNVAGQPPQAGSAGRRPGHWPLVFSVLLALLVVGVWSREAPVTALAEEKAAHSPPVAVDLAVAQRYDVIAELQKINGRLDQIQDVLTSGQVKVTVVQDDKKAEGVHHEATSKP